MTLTVDIDKRIGDLALSTRFASDGPVTALFGRSGAGKTTLVNLIAGLIRPDRGVIRLDDITLVDTERGIDVPAHRRAVGYVFQEGRLFPHLSVRGNLLYGRRFSRACDRWGSLAEVVALLDIGALIDRRPADLSGGEKQRVAIGRALLASPRLLLMDEPLASLDAGLKGEILPYVERLRDEMGLPIVYVSHAIEEVARLADTLVLLADGKVMAAGSVNEVFGRLDLRQYTGQFEASVVLHARVVARDEKAGLMVLDHPAGRLTVPLAPGAVGAAGSIARVRIRARDVALAVGEPGNISIRNRLAGTIREIHAMEGASVEVRLDAGGEPLIARITAAAATALDLKAGQPVVALVKASAFDRLDDFA
jgi:molybdate transport system ATP-binding protein